MTRIGLHAYQVIRQATQDTLQAPDNSGFTILLLKRLLIELESPSQDQQDTADPVMQMEIDPSSQFLSQSSRTESGRANTATLTSSLNTLFQPPPKANTL